MKSGGKTLDVLRGTRLRGKITLSKEKLEELRADIDTDKMIAKKKCKSQVPLTTLDAMSLKCKAAFIKQLYKGISGATVFRGRRAPNIMRMRYGQVQAYLPLVKSVLAGVAKEQAAPQPRVRPTPPTPPAATKPEEDTKLKEAIKGAAYDAIVNDHCGSSSASESTAVGSGKKCKDMGDEPGPLYQKLKQIKLSDMKPVLKAKVVAKFKKAIAADSALKAKYGSMDADALAAKMWSAVGFGTEEPEAVTQPDRRQERRSTEPTKKSESSGGRSGITGYVGVSIATGNANPYTTKPASDSDDKLNKTMPLAFALDAFVGYRAMPWFAIGGRLSLAYTLSDKRQPDGSDTVVDPTHNVTGSLRLEANARVYNKGGHEVMIGASLGAGFMHATKLMLGTLGDGLNVTMPVFAGGIHAIYKNGLFFAKLGFDGDAIISAGTTRPSAYFPSSDEMKGQIKGGAWRLSLGLGVHF